MISVDKGPVRRRAQQRNDSHDPVASRKLVASATERHMRQGEGERHLQRYQIRELAGSCRDRYRDDIC
jgi:hypothetical protein